MKNKSRQLLFIADGEAIIGAKQNRVSERSVILNEDSESIIPVYCVERGRWNYRNSRDFSKSEFSISAKSRDKKAEYLKHNEEHQIQDMVWNDIDELSEKNASHSYTSDLGEVLNARNYDDILEKFNNVDYNGFLVSGTGRPFIEIFSDKTNCKKQLQKSIKSWISDQNERKETDLDVNVCIEKFLNSQWDLEESIGLEKAYSSKENENGRSIFFKDQLVHSYIYF